jgi:hypothetical protein
MDLKKRFKDFAISAGELIQLIPKRASGNYSVIYKNR